MINKKVKHVWMFCIFILCTAAMGFVTMLLWNWLIPTVLGGIVINFWQAIGLLLLARLLFGGFGFHNLHRHWHNHHDRQHAGFREMHSMSRQDRKEFLLRQMKEHGFFCGSDEKDKIQDEDPQ